MYISESFLSYWILTLALHVSTSEILIAEAFFVPKCHVINDGHIVLSCKGNGEICLNVNWSSARKVMSTLYCCSELAEDKRPGLGDKKEDKKN